ncbi:hypothetical protein CRE_04352 [Caenorhabditis remanei]|uniref:DUF38 domain-containing protein n=1 Tax=Caenorhabditis remanei TaxID=31234 RepID=E3NIC6_CAERE|nr:hypothetical protein CRE_04352 [Caenorhabditis remanei]
MRRVCKQMKEVVDNQVIMYKYISISLGANSLCVKLNDKKRVEYQKDTDNSCVIWRPGQPDIKKRAGYVETALKDMSYSLRFLNIRTQKLIIDLEKDAPLGYLHRLAEYFPKRFFAVRIAISICKKTDCPKILELMEPGFLEEIFIEHQTRVCVSNWADSIYELEQWKQATRADTSDYIKLDCKQLKHYYHLKHFEVILNDFTMEQAVIIRDTLASLPQFETCQIFVPGLNASSLKTVWALEEHSGTYRNAIVDFSHYSFSISRKN